MASKRKPPPATAEPAMTTYHVTRKSGRDIRITVPSAWKVTFGPITPGGKHPDNQAPVLRFYEAETKQRAVITDVISFRDASIAIEEKRTSVKQQTMYKDAPDGGKRQVVVEGRVEEWVNPDAPQESGPEFFRLGETDNLIGSDKSLNDASAGACEAQTAPQEDF